MLVPTKIPRPTEAIARQIPREFWRLKDPKHTLSQFLRRETREIQRRIPAYFVVNGYVRRYHRQAARHRFDQGMGKRLGVGRRHVDVASAIKMVQTSIGNGPEFNDLAVCAHIV